MQAGEPLQRCIPHESNWEREAITEMIAHLSSITQIRLKYVMRQRRADAGAVCLRAPTAETRPEETSSNATPIVGRRLRNANLAIRYQADEDSDGFSGSGRARLINLIDAALVATYLPFEPCHNLQAGYDVAINGEVILVGSLQGGDTGPKRAFLSAKSGEFQLILNTG